MTITSSWMVASTVLIIWIDSFWLWMLPKVHESSIVQQVEARSLVGIISYIMSTSWKANGFSQTGNPSSPCIKLHDFILRIIWPYTQEGSEKDQQNKILRGENVSSWFVVSKALQRFTCGTAQEHFANRMPSVLLDEQGAGWWHQFGIDSWH